MDMVNSRGILFFLSFIVLSCRSKECLHNYIKVNNKSSVAIYFNGDGNYPDSNFIHHEFSSVLKDSVHKKLSPQKSGLIYFPGCGEDYLDRNIVNRRIMVYIFDANVIENTPWEEVISNNLYIKRYDLNYNDLDSMGWEINYQ
jgi:hypothetical protein